MRVAACFSPCVAWAGRRGITGIAILVLLAGTLQAGTLDATVDGDDIVLTWDTGTDDLLRGTTPDALAPWLTFVTSPLRVPNENVLRGENAFYRLASGSNMAYRIERTYTVDLPGKPWAVATTLPERHAYVTSFGLLRAWPTLVEINWWDSARQLPMAASNAGVALVGHDVPLPRHGGVWLAFGETTTVTIVGSSDPTFAGIVQGDIWGNPGGVPLPVPPDGRWQDSWQILCGERDSDWFDVDGDGFPDECGRDVDGDGWPDTGLWGGPIDTGRPASLQFLVYGSPESQTGDFGRVSYSYLDGRTRAGGNMLTVEVGAAFQASAENARVARPFSVPRW